MQRLSGRSKRRPVSALVAALAVAAMAAFGSSGATARGASGGGSKGGANVLSTTPNLSCKGVQTGETLNVGVAMDVVSFDPPYTQDNGSLWADMNIYDQLVELTPTAKKLVPALATSWKVSNGGKDYTFNLRKNARFSNGDPVTAQDVAFSLARAASPKAFANVGLSIIKSTKVINAHKIEVVTGSVSAAFLNELALWPASILDEKVFKKDGEATFKDHPVGFPVQRRLLQARQRDRAQEEPVLLGQGQLRQSLPLSQRGRAQVHPERQHSRHGASRWPARRDVQRALQRGQLAERRRHHGRGDPPVRRHPVRPQPPAPGFRNTKVIQAINYAIDRQAIVKAVYFGHGSAADSPIDPGVDFYTGKYGYTFNLPKAKALMKASGVKSVSATMTLPSGDATAAAIGQIVQSELKPIGVNIAIHTLDPTTLNSEQEQQKLQITYGAGTSDNLDPSANMLFCCVSNGGAYSSYTGWVDKAADKLFNQTQVALNPAKRGALYAKWQKIIMQKGPFVWVVNPTNTFAYHKNVHDFFLQPTAHYLYG